MAKDCWTLADAEKPRIKISVRNMVEFLLRSGDIEPTGSGGSKAMQRGTRVHRKLQKEAGENYQAEVRLSCETEFTEFLLVVDGIADGIFDTGEGTTLEEIKSTMTPPEQIEEDSNPLHWAQAKCYGWMLLHRTDLPEVTIRLTYFHVETGRIRRFDKTFQRKELQDFFQGLAEQYAKWAHISLQNKGERDRSARALPFPFSHYRRGQRELAVGVYRAVRDQKLLFAQSPTGTGKTISTLYPAVKAMGEGMGEKIFYLTAKTVTRQAAEQAIRIMEERGLVFRRITLTAKEKICLCPDVSCDPKECDFACGHYDRINEAVLDLLAQERDITRETVIKYAKKHCVCPFEYELDISLWMDCIICDYNYAFDPRAYLRRYFDSGGDYVLLVDEAHNLVERARDMYSAELSKQEFLKQRKVLKETAPKAYQEIREINRIFLAMRREFAEEEGTRTAELPTGLHAHVERFTEALEAFLESRHSGRGDSGLLDLFFHCRTFLTVFRLYDERYVTCVTRRNQEIRLKLFCVDPSGLLRKACEKGRSAVFFSGTLQPLNFYRDMLGGEETDPTLCLPSPFPPENLCVMTAGNLSTRYRDRENSCAGIAGYIRAVTRRPGNYMAFFPSFQYMNQVYETYRSLWPKGDTRIQESHMKEEQREEFLNSFEADPPQSMIAFAVLGGIFSEGIDLAGDRLSGAVIVSVGLPQLSPERDIMSRYYRQRNGHGFEYACQFPGMNRVLQAAGRVIRTGEDKGFVLLLDDRFLHRRYRDLFPAEWQGGHRVFSPEAAGRILDDFWST